MELSNVTLVSAFAAGVVSFLSPCVLPVVPGYLSVITGSDIAGGDGERPNLGRIARDTGLFVIGFGSVFVLLGLTATSLGDVLVRNQTLLTRVSGLLILAMGGYLLGSLALSAPWLYGEKRAHPDLTRFGPFAAPVAGVAFGFGWTPCIGPVLTSILAVAATTGDARQGALLLGTYALGLGVPFMVTGLAFGRLAGAFAWVKRRMRGITLATGLTLVLFGALLTLDRLVWVTTQLQRGAAAVGLDILIELG